MKKIIAYIILVAMGCGMCMAQPAIVQPPGYELSRGRKAVDRSTDIAALVLPTAALIGTLCARDWEGLLQGVETAAAAAATTYALKYLVKERRPDNSGWHSFPSGHSAVSFATATYLTRRYGWQFGVPAYIVSTYVAWGRCFARQHYVWDCLVGAAIGAGSALIFTTPFARKHDLQMAPVADGRTMGMYASFTF